MTLQQQQAAGAAPAADPLAAIYDTLTIGPMFRQTVARQAARPALRAKQADGAWHDITYGELQQQVEAFAASLIEQGLQPGDRVAMLSENRPEWVVANLGITHAGGCDVPLYPTLTPQQMAYILNDSGASLVVLSNGGHLGSIAQVADQLPALKGVIIFDDPQGAGAGLQLWRLAEFMEAGRQALPRQQAEIERRLAATGPQDLAGIVYTSGTTGEPKGAMLTHRNIVSNVLGGTRLISYVPDDIELSFLPLSHVLERIIYYCGIYAGATIAYAESFDTVPANLREVRPTMVASVPRLFEKIHARIMEGVEQGSFIKRSLFRWAIQVGRKRRAALKRDGKLSPLLAMQAGLAQRLVFAKIHAATGGRIRYFISGGAPLRRDIAEFFADVGLIILEGYGLTETSPIITFNRPEDFRFGTVGPPIAGVEVKIAPDGEILSRGPNIMKGYWNKPEATAEAIDPEGWFHTGDIGELDADGYLRITDRKKELLVLSNGKNVAPQPIENLLKSSLYIEQAVVIGDNRNFVSALLVPNAAQLKLWASQRQLPTGDAGALLKRPEVRSLFQSELDRFNHDLARYEQIKQFALLDRELSQEQNELTPTLKFKRRVIVEHFKDAIDSLYTAPAHG